MTTTKARLQSNSKKAAQSYQQPKTLSGLVAFFFIFTIAITIGWIFISYLLSPVKDRPIIQRLERIDGRLNKVLEEQEQLKSHVTSQTAPLQQINAVPRIRLLSQRSPGGSWTDRINARLAGTPMAGHGRDFVLAAADAGIPPNLSVAIALHESGAGRFTPPGSHNPYGMTGPTSSDFWDVPGKGPDGTRSYQAYPDWETAIRYHARFIVAMWGPVTSPYQMKGYAESGAWAAGASSKMAQI